jgi:hypothetical protein
VLALVVSFIIAHKPLVGLVCSMVMSYVLESTL